MYEIRIFTFSFRKFVSMANYGDKYYWDNRYLKENDTTEWFQAFSGMKPIVSEALGTGTKILVVGCGNSRMSEDILACGVASVTSIDFSSVVVKLMSERYEKEPNLKFQEMDVRDMKEFEDGAFDAVVDKGCLDSMLCLNGAAAEAAKALAQISRVLKEGGNYIMLSHGSEDQRSNYLKHSAYNWVANSPIAIPKPPLPVITGPNPIPPNVAAGLARDANHYLYVCKKNVTVLQKEEAPAGDEKAAPGSDVNPAAAQKAA